MKTLLIISHGSRRKESLEEVEKLSARIIERAGDSVDAAKSSYLSLGKPTIEEAVSELVNKGADEIVVFPFFLAAGTHVAKDIPEIIEGERKKYPSVSFKLTAHLGAVTGIDKVILDEVKRA